MDVCRHRVVRTGALQLCNCADHVPSGGDKLVFDDSTVLSLWI